MPIEKIPQGTRGGGVPPGFLMKPMAAIMRRVHKRAGDRFSGLNVLYLHTVGAKTGQDRVATVAKIDDGAGNWLICASSGGAKEHPAWYHNIVAHPDQVSIEFGGQTHAVDVEQLRGAEREAAWQQIVQQVPRFAGYTTKTDRELPVLRLTPKA